MIQRFLPAGPGKSTMRYEVYRNKSSSDEDFEVIDSMYKRIMSEDKYLCANAQKNISAGVFVAGELHPIKEKGPLYFQKLVRESMMKHHQREAAAEKEIWPARQTLPRGEVNTDKDVGFCATVGGCGNVGKEALAF